MFCFVVIIHVLDTFWDEMRMLGIELFSNPIWSSKKSYCKEARMNTLTLVPRFGDQSSALGPHTLVLRGFELFLFNGSWRPRIG